MVYMFFIGLIFMVWVREIQPYAHELHNILAYYCALFIVLCVTVAIIFNYNVLDPQYKETFGWLLLLLNMGLFALVYLHGAPSANKYHRAATLKRDDEGHIVEQANIDAKQRESLARKGFAARSISIVEDAAEFERSHSLIADEENDASEAGEGEIQLKDMTSASL